MAVKRETRQFKVGPIGVARSSRSGAIIGEAVADSANALSDIFINVLLKMQNVEALSL